MSSDSTAQNKPGYRCRRSHRKSRTGCFRCKKQKRKCDERSPRCSRCERLDACCQKPDIKVVTPPKESLAMGMLVFSTDDRPEDIGVTSDLNIPALCSHEIISAGCSACVEEAAILQSPTEAGRWDEVLQVPHALDSTQRELFDYYLMHTSRSVAANNADLYALKMGIGKLACVSKIIMNSVLALAAVNKCHDIMSGPTPCYDDCVRVPDLLLSAESYYCQALQQARNDEVHMGRYDHVMANAALMVLYGCASHSIRIKLAGEVSEDINMPSELVPVTFRWISLIRAIQVAYSGLVSARPSQFIVDKVPISTPVHTCSNDTWPSSMEEEQLFRDNGPTERTRLLFLPIIATTWVDTFDKLHNKVDAAISAGRRRSVISEGNGTDMKQQPNDNYLSDLFVCMSALDLLHSIFCKIFPAGAASQSPAPGIEQDTIYEHCASSNGLSELEPWMRGYLSRITGKTPHQSLRRVIMAFIHQVPARYVDLVQKALDRSATRNLGDDAKADCRQRDYDPTALEAQKLAIDIFAHWLVLVIVLDGVWWIGDIGMWELRGVISAMRDTDRFGGAQIRDGWWPQSMYIIKERLGRV